MANEKQDGSNIINAEFTTGRCQSQCEQCFVNFGQQGSATCRDWANPEMESSVEFTKRIARDFSEYSIYTPPKRVPASYDPGPDREALSYEITSTGRPGFYMIPTRGAWAAWVTQKKYADKRKRRVVSGLEELGELPFFLRVSSMSDSSYAPPPWIATVREAWGDHCFFNSAIKSLRRTAKHAHRREVLGEYHKLVVTVNPGHQEPFPMRPAKSRPIDPAHRSIEADAWAEQNAGKAVYGSMGKVGNRQMDYFHPQDVTDIGLRDLEQVIKFYRLRALPTIRPRFETDAPVVVTQMRFKGVDHLLEFARRYRLDAEVVYPDRMYKKNGDFKAGGPNAEVLSQFDFTLTRDSSVERTIVRLRSGARDQRNASPYRKDATEFIFEGSYYRPHDIYLYEKDAYVCDRLRGGCSFCGLCASLDGTQGSIDGVPFANPLNKIGRDHLLPYPGPDGAGYIGVLATEPVNLGTKRAPILVNPGDVFAQRMQALGVEADLPRALEVWRRNPSEIDVASPELCYDLLGTVAAYLEKDTTEESEVFCEGWNTHENAATTTAYAVWSLMVEAREKGLTKPQMFEFVAGFVNDAADGRDVLAGIDDLWGMWDGVSPWNDVFGEVG